jgi:UDP-2,3-diacylglucosamine hydrolase
MKDTILFVSDLHLKGLDDPRQEAFVSWLEEKAPSLSRLVIGGDLFDVWIGFKDVGYYHYLSVLEAFRKLKKQGVEIDYIEGNHDFFLGPFFTDVLKANIFEREAIYYSNGFKVLVTHGDLLNTRDVGYQLLRLFFRSLPFQWLIKMTPPSWIWTIGQKLSHLSKGAKGARGAREARSRQKEESQEKVVSLYRKLAEEKFRRSPDLDILIAGHNHCPDHYTFEYAGKKRSYFNLGDWVKHFTYLEYRPVPPSSKGEFSLKKYCFTPQNEN